MKDRMKPAQAQGGGTKAAFFVIMASGCLVVGTALTIGDAIFMSEGAKLMAPGDSAALMGLMAIAGAVGKAIVWPCAAECIKARYYGYMLIAVVVGCFLHTFSMVAMTGLAASGRDALISGRGNAQDVHARALTAYNDAVARARLARATRSEAAIRADILKTDAELVTAKADMARARYAELPGLRAHRDLLQAKRDGLAIELDAAAAYIQAQADVTAAKSVLDRVGAPLTRDPQAEALSRYGLPVELVARLLPLMPSLLVEFGGGIFFLLGGVLIGLAGQARTVCPATVVTATTGERSQLQAAVTNPVMTTVTTVATASPVTKPVRPAADVTKEAAKEATGKGGEKRLRTPTARITEATPTILRLAAEGMSGLRIAAATGLKPTVVKNILAKAKSQGLVTKIVTNEATCDRP